MPTVCPDPVNYCVSSPNTTGQSALISWQGSTSVGLNALTLTASNLPLSTGIFAASPDPDSVPLGNGTLCLGTDTLGFVIRLTPSFVGSPAGAAQVTLDLSAGPFPVSPGETWRYQAWYRDSVQAGFDFSNGLEVIYCP